MNHLSDEQLSGLLDDALPASERAACDAHLGGCDACRSRLAEISALEETLGKALAHDPGEAYFAGFADRVAKRIAGRRIDAPLPIETPRARRSMWAWLTSPRGLTLAGSTAALLAAAGLAWMRFHNEQDVARALREAAPSTRTSAPGASDELSRAPAAVAPAPPAPAPPASAERARADGAAPSRDLARMQEARTLPNGEQVPVERAKEQAGAPAQPGAAGNALAAPATGSAIAQMKKRAVAPAVEGGAPAAASLKTESAPREEVSKDAEAGAPQAQNAPPAANFAPAPPAVKSAPAQHQKALETSRAQSLGTWGANKSLEKSGAPNELKADARRATALAATCGKVRDSRGTVVAGAEITAVRSGVRTSRTDGDGSFCIDGLSVGDTLTVMHVGFDPYTVVVTPMTSLAITLEPVGTLGPNSTMLTGKPPSPAATFSGALKMHASADTFAEPPPDVYAGQSYGIRQLVRDARDATAVARHERTAPSFETAARHWAAVMGQVKGAPAYDARYQYVDMVRQAYQLDPTSERASRLGSSYAAFLATVPDSLPAWATVKGWQQQLQVPPGH